jgi:hypothetical protein
MSKVSKNQRPAKKADNTPLVRAVRTHYGFNKGAWLAVTADNLDQAEAIIRAELKLSAGDPLTVKPI